MLGIMVDSFPIAISGVVSPSEPISLEQLATKSPTILDRSLIILDSSWMELSEIPIPRDFYTAYEKLVDDLSQDEGNCEFALGLLSCLEDEFRINEELGSPERFSIMYNTYQEVVGYLQYKEYFMNDPILALEMDSFDNRVYPATCIGVLAAIHYYPKPYDRRELAEDLLYSLTV